jgi:Flp pilus assembly protein TadB
MPADAVLLASLGAIAAFVALPAVAAAFRRRRARECGAVAAALTDFALAARRSIRAGVRCLPLDAALCSRAGRLRFPEFASLLLAHELSHDRSELMADTAQRLALRLKRRVAFERKMLARTASGRRRGAVAAAVPPFVLLLVRAAHIDVPAAALLVLLAIEGAGCWLLWRLSRVEI